MEQLEVACEVAVRLCTALDDAIVIAKDLAAPMARLEAQALFSAASRRNESNAQVASLVAQLGEAVRAIAGVYGWSELTLVRLKEVQPDGGRKLEELLAQVRKRAATLHDIDDVNKARGNRALAWMRILIAGHTGQPAMTAYDRRGGTVAPRLSTSTRTL